MSADRHILTFIVALIHLEQRSDSIRSGLPRVEFTPILSESRFRFSGAFQGAVFPAAFCCAIEANIVLWLLYQPGTKLTEVQGFRSLAPIKQKGTLSLPTRFKVMHSSGNFVEKAGKSTGSHFARNSLLAVTAVLALAVAGCQSSNTHSALSTVDRAQGSSENISSLTSVIQSNPRDPEAYNVRGSAYGKARRYKEALRDFDQAIALNPNFYQAYANRALIYRYMGDSGKAAQDYSRAIQINPQYDAAYVGRGNVYRLAGRLDQALSDFNQAISLQTTDGRAYHNRGLIYQAKGQHKQAIEDFSKAISLNSTAPEPYNGRGISYVALGDYDNAFDDFNTAITLDGNVAESWSNQALVYEQRGDKAKAANSYSRAIQLDANYQPAKAGLARTRG